MAAAAKAYLVGWLAKPDEPPSARVMGHLWDDMLAWHAVCILDFASERLYSRWFDPSSMEWFQGMLDGLEDRGFPVQRWRDGDTTGESGTEPVTGNCLEQPETDSREAATMEKAVAVPQHKGDE